MGKEASVHGAAHIGVCVMATFVLLCCPSHRAVAANPEAGLSASGPDTSAIMIRIRLAEGLARTYPDSAIHGLESAWAKIPQATRWQVGFRYFMGIAEIRFNKGDMAVSMQACDSAMRYRRNGREAQDEAYVGMLQGRIFNTVGEYGVALRILEGALDIFTRIGDVRSMAECDDHIAWGHYVQEQYELAERRWRAMLGLARRAGDRKLEAIALRRVGLACLYRYADSGIGHAYYDSALVVSRILGDPHELAAIHSNIGTHMDSALFYANATGDQDLVHSIMHTAGIMDISGHGGADEAVTYCAQVLAFAQRTGNRMMERDAWDCLGTGYKYQGRWKSAFFAHEERDRIDRQIISSRTRDEISMRAIGREFETRHYQDSITYAAERARLQDARTIERLRADGNRNRAWAITVGGLVLIGVGVAYYRYERRRRQDRADRHASELEIKALRAQMNPHFLFNALNSINDHVQDNDAEVASDFLVRFSRLMRQVLEMSRLNEVPLQRELAVIGLYAELERMRLKDRFNFALTTSPEVDPSTVLVPPMILQPFAENAIWHGLSRKKESGQLNIHAAIEDDVLRITIEDDGPGRQAAVPARGEHRSLGTTITKERLDLWAAQHRAPATFRYVDVPMGTRVELSLPLIHL